MNLQDYFDNTEGWGVLSTADARGRVNSALFARPHFLDGRKASFVMAERLTHKNLRENPHATYLFLEKGAAWQGKRLLLRRMSEKSGHALIAALRRRPCPVRAPKTRSFLVTFKVEKVLPLVGT